MNSKKTANLNLYGVELNLNLGWSAEERAIKQKTLIDVLLSLPKPPQACVTDNIVDTYCYANIINTVINETEQREFHLVEHLGAHIYNLVKKIVPTATIQISVHKNLSVVNLPGKVTFQYGDNEN